MSLKPNRRALNVRLKKIRCLLMDVDGVLTDGKLHFTCDGKEFKSFDVQDGHGIAMAQRNGLLIGFISGRPSEATAKRAADLGVKICLQAGINKAEMLEQVQRERNLRPEEIAFIGDELVDLPVLRRVGFAVAVPNAAPEAKAVAHYTTKHTGGNGAVREVIEMILKTRGLWQTAIAKYLVILVAGLMLTSLVRADSGSTNNAPATNAGFIERFEYPERDEEGKLKYMLKGEKAVFRPDGLMEVQNLRVETYSSNRVSMVFTTPTCTVDQVKKRGATASPVKLERPDMIVTGVGGTWNDSKKLITINSNVRVVLTGNDKLFAIPGNNP